MRIANVVAQRSLGLKPDVGRLLSHLSQREPGSANSAIRYRWELSHRRVDPPAYAGPLNDWKTWRPREQEVFARDPIAFEERLTVPILLAEATHLLQELAQEPSSPRGLAQSSRETTAVIASRMLAECEPLWRRDLAQYLQMLNSWDDTFALFCLAQRPAALARHRPLALAISAAYVASAQVGYLRGTRFPFHDQPLVSATAHLAAGLLGLGSEFELLGRMVTTLRRTRRPSGGFGDAQEPEDVLTTLAAAQILGGLDPAFEVGPTARYLASQQDPQGFFRALGPEVPWLTGLVVNWLQGASKPFAERFLWPSPNEGNTDRKTRLAGFQYFLELCDLLKGCPCLASSTLPFAFIDLVGFRAFNNQCGQDAGDQALECCAEALSELPAVKIVRDGGDEFLVIGAPTRGPLLPDLLSHREAWPERFFARFGKDVPLVRMRALVGYVKGSHLRDAREIFGRRIGELKNIKENDGAVIRDVGAIA